MKNKKLFILAIVFFQPLLVRSLAAKNSMAVHQTENWLLNGDFEDLNSTDWEGGGNTTPGHQSAHALYLKNEKPDWSAAKQTRLFGAEKPAEAALSGWMRTRDVIPGKEKYMEARLTLNFYDDNNNLVGGYQPSAASASGTTAWTYYQHRYQVPPAATRAVVEAALPHCVGEAWFDDLTLQFLDAQGASLTPPAATQSTNTSDWWAYQPPSDPSGATLDLSYLIEKPAGKHGFIGVKDGHFVFADGSRARFWGTDLVASNAFPTHRQAEQTARRLARLGVNLVRLHHMDAAWSTPNIFMPGSDNTQTFSPESMDRLDYLIYCLKENGIYIYPDLSVNRVFREGDQVPEYKDLEAGSKGAIHFDKRLQELNKQYANMLFGRKNNYTGLALKDDPIVLGTEVVNESSIFSGFGQQDFPPSYEAELQKQYEDWGGKGKLTRFGFDWAKNQLVAKRNPENADQSLRFLAETEAKSYQDMRNYLHSMGAHMLVNGSNIGLHMLAEIKNNSQMDYMDTHAYWDHPQVWKMPNTWAQIDYAPFDNKPQLRDPQGNIIGHLADWRVDGKPLMVTEWNDCFPNEYRLEGPLMVAAYSCLQDWDGLLQFDYNLDPIGTVKMSPFSINTRPDNEALYQAAALIFHQQMLAPAPQQVAEPLSDDLVLKSPSANPWLKDHPWLPFALRVAKRFTGDKQEASPNLNAFTSLHDDANKVILASSGQLRLDYGQGILSVNAPQVQGFVGAIGDQQKRSTPFVSVSLAKRNPWAALLLISQDQKPLAQSSKFLVLAVARAENSGQVYNATRTALKEPGKLPILMQGVEAELVFPSLAKEGQVSIHPLDENGRPRMALKADKNPNLGLLVSISPKDQASYYQVEIKR